MVRLRSPSIPSKVEGLIFDIWIETCDLCLAAESGIPAYHLRPGVVTLCL